MEFVDYNIEILHFEDYKQATLENSLPSVLKAKEFIDKLQRKNCSFCITILIDDKKNYDYTGDKQVILDLISQIDILKVDYICYESKLSELAPILLNLISSTEIRQKICHQMNLNISKYKNIGCKLDIAIWHLLRLGIIKCENLIANYVFPLSELVKPFTAKNVVSILSNNYKTVESKADKDILSHIKIPDINSKIHRIYY